MVADESRLYAVSRRTCAVFGLHHVVSTVCQVMISGGSGRKWNKCQQGPPMAQSVHRCKAHCRVQVEPMDRNRLNGKICKVFAD